MDEAVGSNPTVGLMIERSACSVRTGILIRHEGIPVVTVTISQFCEKQGLVENYFVCMN